MSLLVDVGGATPADARRWAPYVRAARRLNRAHYAGLEKRLLFARVAPTHGCVALFRGVVGPRLSAPPFVLTPPPPSATRPAILDMEAGGGCLLYTSDAADE